MSQARAETGLRQPGLLVYLSGVGTSALVLWLIRIAAAHGENVMGWYANGIIPIGALLVGVASGSGYAIASYALDVKLSRPFVMGMISTGLVDYGAAQYFDYLDLLERHHASTEAYSFLRFLADQCEQMSFRSSGSSSVGTPLGVFGYLFKALEIAGFSAGTMAPSAILRGMPYCRRCQNYLKKHRIGFASSTTARAEVFKLPKKERAAGLVGAVNEVAARASELVAQVAELSLADTEAALAALEPAARKESAALVTVTLKKCPRCDAHHLKLMLSQTTLDKKVAKTSLGTVDKTN